MITLKSPINLSRQIVGYTVLGYSERRDLNNPGAGTINASVRIHYSDKTYKDDTFTLWDGADTPAVVKDGKEVAAAVVKENSYAAAGQWTDETAEARIAELLAQ